MRLLHDSRRTLSNVNFGFLKYRTPPQNSILSLVNQAWQRCGGAVYGHKRTTKMEDRLSPEEGFRL
jgi:hypothetical protein